MFYSIDFRFVFHGRLSFGCRFFAFHPDTTRIGRCLTTRIEHSRSDDRGENKPRDFARTVGKNGYLVSGNSPTFAGNGRRTVLHFRDIFHSEYKNHERGEAGKGLVARQVSRKHQLAACSEIVSPAGDEVTSL